MTNNNPTNLEIIKQACVRANPEIMELKFGCEVYCEQGWEDENGNYHDEYGVVVEKPDSEGTCQVLTESRNATGDRFIWPMLPTEILGRPITLDDVLLAVRKATCNMQIPADDRGAPDFTCRVVKVWDLTKSLEFQSEKTLNFLAQLLHE